MYKFGQKLYIVSEDGCDADKCIYISSDQDEEDLGLHDIAMEGCDEIIEVLEDQLHESFQAALKEVIKTLNLKLDNAKESLHKELHKPKVHQLFPGVQINDSN